MIRPRVIRGLAAIALLGAGPSGAGAQPAPSIALSTWLEGRALGGARSALWLDPAVGLGAEHASFGLEGRFAALGAATREQGGRATGSLRLDLPGPWQSEIALTTVHRFAPTRSQIARPGVRLHLAGTRAGAWVAASAEAALGTADGLRGTRLPLLGFGGWARRRRLMVAGSVEQNAGVLRTFHSASRPDTGRMDAGLPALIEGAPRQVLLTTAFSSLHWYGDRVEMESVGGVTLGPLARPRRWAQASLAWRVSPQLAVVATAGSRSPQYFALDPTGEPRTALALRFSQWRSASAAPVAASRAGILDCRARAVGAGRYAITVRARGARDVEMIGDMTDWRPLALQALGGDRWEVAVDMAPGVHQLDLRVDGGPWAPPPGFPSVADGFSGMVGVIVVE